MMKVVDITTTSVHYLDQEFKLDNHQLAGIIEPIVFSEWAASIRMDLYIYVVTIRWTTAH